MLTYGTYDDYTRMKKINQSEVTVDGERTITDYLKRATEYIDRVTHRRYFPWYEMRSFSMPTDYIDLANRAQNFNDLYLDQDLLETHYVQVSNLNTVDSNEDVPVGGLTIIATTFTASDVDGLDANGIARISAGDILLIDDEYMAVVSANTSTNLVTVNRGVIGTIPAAHTAGTTIYKASLQLMKPGIDYHLLDYNVDPKFAIRLVWPNTWSGLYGGSFWKYRYPQIFVSGFWGFHEQYRRDAWINTTENCPAMTDTATSIAVTDVNGTDAIGEPRFEVGYCIRIENELMEVVSLDTTDNEVAVLRGQRGTTALAHASGNRIYRFSIHEPIREACLVIAKTWRDADNSVGGRQGVSEISTGVEISVPKDMAEILGMHIRAIVY
jgi:hypothetical protein